MSYKQFLGMGVLAVMVFIQTTSFTYAFSNSSHVAERGVEQKRLNKSLWGTSQEISGKTNRVKNKQTQFDTKFPKSVGEVKNKEVKRALGSINGLLQQSDRVTLQKIGMANSKLRSKTQE